MIHEALRLIRVYHDMKQNEVATKLGISKSYLSEIERGHKEPSLELLRKYEAAFQIPTSSIMFFSENLDESPAREKARNFVAAKIIRLMKFLEVRAENADVE